MSPLTAVANAQDHDQKMVLMWLSSPAPIRATDEPSTPKADVHVRQFISGAEL